MYASLVVDIIPRDLVLHSSCYWCSNSENQSSIKSFFQKAEDLITFSVIRKIGSTLGAVKPLARVRMLRALSSRWKRVVDDDCTTICISMTHIIEKKISWMVACFILAMFTQSQERPRTHVSYALRTSEPTICWSWCMYNTATFAQENNHNSYGVQNSLSKRRNFKRLVFMQKPVECV